MGAKVLSGDEWVRLAVSRDVARPVLCSVHVFEGGVVEASDGYRAHRASGSALRPGLWDAKSGAACGGAFPTLDRVIPTGPDTHEIKDVGEVLAVCAASIAYQRARKDVLARVTFRCDMGYLSYSAFYLQDALRGAQLGEGVSLRAVATSDIGVMRMSVRPGWMAVIMPQRDGGRDIEHTQPSARFDVSEFIVARSSVVAA